MRVMQVVNVRWFNATAWYGLYLARLFREAGHPTCVLTLPGTLADARAREWGLEPVGLDVNSTNPLHQPHLLRQLARQVRAFRPDVVNCHRGEGFGLFGLLRHAGREPFALVRTRGDQRLPRANVFNRLLYARAADAVIATNSRMAAHLRHKMGVERLATILGGVDTARFGFDPAGREQVRQEFGFAPDVFVFGLLGRLDPVKGQRDFLRAVGAAARSGHRVGALVVGFDANIRRSEVEGWIREEGLAGTAFVTGRREDIGACLSALDAGVIASTGSEAIARAALELMAAGRPILSSDVGVMPDLVEAAALFPPGDSRALAARMERLMSDAPWQTALLDGQRQKLATLDSREFLHRTLQVYECALERKKRRGATPSSC